MISPSMLPSWAPGWHPLVVHFPVALVVVAFVADGVAVALRRRDVAAGATALHVLAALGALGAFWTGQRASESADVPVAAVTTLTAHADMALYTVWWLGLYAMLRIGVGLYVPAIRPALFAPLAVLGLGGVILVAQTAERGGTLVYAHGVGVQPQEPASSRSVGSTATPDGLWHDADGGWTWNPVPGQPLPSGLVVIEGEAAALHAVPPGAPGDSLVAFHLGGGTLLFVGGTPNAGVRIDAALDLSGFEGTVALVHHVQDAANYDFLSFSSEQTVLGRRQGAREIVFGRAAATPSSAFQTRVTAQGTHFYGHVNERAPIHGHGAAPAAGRAGLRLEGTGTVRVGRMSVTPIRS